MIEGSIARAKTVPSVHPSNIRAQRYLKQRLIDPKGEVDDTTILTGYFFFTLSVVDPDREIAGLTDNSMKDKNIWSS